MWSLLGQISGPATRHATKGFSAGRRATFLSDCSSSRIAARRSPTLRRAGRARPWGGMTHRPYSLVGPGQALARIAILRPIEGSGVLVVAGVCVASVGWLVLL